MFTNMDVEHFPLMDTVNRQPCASDAARIYSQACINMPHNQQNQVTLTFVFVCQVTQVTLTFVFVCQVTQVTH